MRPRSQNQQNGGLPRRKLGVQVIDLFCGCGGMSYGFASAKTRNVRYAVTGALDLDKHAVATYHRMLGVEPLCADIRSLVERSEFAKATRHWNHAAGTPTILIGCAPCQGFSSHRKKDDRQDDRNSLLEVFAHIILKLQPEIVVMENVPEMLAVQHWRHFEDWHLKLTQAGYHIRSTVYNLAQFGVPQERFRVLVVASRIWPKFDLPAPTHTPGQYVTVRQAIAHLPPLKAGGADPTDPMHLTSRHRKETVALIRMIPPDGGSRRSLPLGVGPACLQRVDGFRDVYGRLSWDSSAVAITARCRTPSCGRYTHPEQHRGLSVREAALLQGFPSDYYFEGPFDDKYKQIGNAVSPIFARAIAEHLDREWALDHSRASEKQTAAGDITGPFRKSFSSSIASIKRRERLDQPLCLF